MSEPPVKDVVGRLRRGAYHEIYLSRVTFRFPDIQKVLKTPAPMAIFGRLREHVNLQSKMDYEFEKGWFYGHCFVADNRYPIVEKRTLWQIVTGAGVAEREGDYQKQNRIRLSIDIITPMGSGFVAYEDLRDPKQAKEWLTQYHTFRTALSNNIFIGGTDDGGAVVDFADDEILNPIVVDDDPTALIEGELNGQLVFARQGEIDICEYFIPIGPKDILVVYLGWQAKDSNEGVPKWFLPFRKAFFDNLMITGV